MYSPRRSYGSPPPELSNNPFIDHPSNALTRYPDITGDDNPANFPPAQSSSWIQPSGSNLISNNSPYLSTPSQPQQQVPYGGGYQPPQQTGWNGATSGFQPNAHTGSGFASPQVQPQGTGRAFQPSSAFGQQLAGQLNGGYGVVPQQQPQQQQYTGYPTTPTLYVTGYQTGFGPQQQPQVPQQQQRQPYLSEFDPYGPQTTQSASQPQGPGSQYRPPHPREYVQKHKTELESWDSYAWKQVLNSFDTLKDAWVARKTELEGRVKAMGGAGLFGGGNVYGGGGMYGGQGQELARLEHLIKEADNNFDSVAASTFQMQEVFNGYRQSGDIASKRRVRESINAALGNLPDWPSQAY